MSHLRPVSSNYQPEYPRFLTQAEVADLLRPSLFHRFSRATLLTGAMITGAIAATFGAQAAEPGKSTRTDAKLKERVDAVVAEVLGPVTTDPKDPAVVRNYWYKRSFLAPASELASNPPVKYPRIPISYGNSYCGVFDATAARAATLKLFAAYGIELKADQTVRTGDYEFVADGYDERTKTGFKIVMPPGGGGRGLGGPAPAAPVPRVRPDGNPGFVGEEKDLDDAEQKALDADVKAGKLKFFVVKAQGFPNMDGDQYTPLKYYMASVVDYLNYVHGDAQIDPKTVLGETMGDKDPRIAQRVEAAVARVKERQAAGDHAGALVELGEILRVDPENEYARAEFKKTNEILGKTSPAAK